jgi:hypothetical protein
LYVDSFLGTKIEDNLNPKKERKKERKKEKIKK